MNQLITIYFLNKKQNNFLFYTSLLGIILIFIRIKITHSYFFLFLVWNLFLAIIPYFISNNLKLTFNSISSSIKSASLFLIWLLFIPNSFYLITDFVHLHFQNRMQFIYDFILLTIFSIAGFLFGILSILQFHVHLKVFITKLQSVIFLVSISYLSAFGIYLGRFLRFNSWDILQKPAELLLEILNSFLKIQQLQFTFLLGTVIVLCIFIYLQFTTKFNKFK